jgi:hypothetical protein
LYGWYLLIPILFWRLAPHQAVAVMVITGTLFLPEVQMSPVSPDAPDPNSLRLFGLFRSTKPNTVNFGALLGVLVFDRRRLLSFRPRWFDLPMTLWCLLPAVSDWGVSRASGALAAAWDSWFLWGIPYLLGRVYFSDPANLRDLLVGVVLGGLAYVPLCLVEMRFFPSLHERVYGFFPGDPRDVFRWGGFRPIGFMSHALMTALWLWATALTAVWLWRTRAVRRLPLGVGRGTVPTGLAAFLLVFTAALSRSTGATVLGLACLAALFQLRWVRAPLLLAGLLAFAPLQIGLRSTVGWEDPARMGRQSRDPADAAFSEKIMSLFMPWEAVLERRDSHTFRGINDNYLIRKAWSRPFFGYGDTGLARKVPEMKVKPDDPDYALTDSFWVIVLCCYGFVGLVAVYTAMLLPALRFLAQFRRQDLASAALAPAAAATAILILYMTDNLSNGFFNSVYVLLAGGLMGWSPSAAAGAEAEPPQSHPWLKADQPATA